jgi:hypothetical protein
MSSSDWTPFSIGDLVEIVGKHDQAGQRGYVGGDITNDYRVNIYVDAFVYEHDSRNQPLPCFAIPINCMNGVSHG